MQQWQKSLKSVHLNHHLWILERFATSMIIIVICQYLNHTECLAGVILRKNTKKLGSSFCSPWEGHLNFPADSEGSYFTYLGDYYLIENYIFPFAKGIIEKKNYSAEFPHLSECFIIRIFKNPSDIKGKLRVLYLIFNFLCLWKKHVVENMKHCLVSFQNALWRVQQWDFCSMLSTSLLCSLGQEALSIPCLHSSFT